MADHSASIRVKSTAIVRLDPLSVLALVLVGRWGERHETWWAAPAEPFRIAGNLTLRWRNGRRGLPHLRARGSYRARWGYPSTAPLIIASIAKLVSACDLGRLATSQYPWQTADLERSFKVLRGLPVDIWVRCHARSWAR